MRPGRGRARGNVARGKEEAMRERGKYVYEFRCLNRKGKVVWKGKTKHAAKLMIKQAKCCLYADAGRFQWRRKKKRAASSASRGHWKTHVCGAGRRRSSPRG